MMLPPRIPVHMLRGCRRPLGVAGIRCTLPSAAAAAPTASSSPYSTTPAATPPAADTRHKVLVVGGGRMGQIRASAFFGSRKSHLAGGSVRFG